jgi:hypothetical protein
MDSTLNGPLFGPKYLHSKGPLTSILYYLKTILNKILQG